VDINATTVLVAALGAGGLGAILREIFAGLGKLTRGVSLKESTRKIDLVSQRDDALRRASHLQDERDREERNRRRIEAYTARLERLLILAGLDGQLPAQPVLEDTITPARLRQIKEAHDG
jgi:hypothetical protein